MQRNKKANVKQLKANIFYSSSLAVCIFFFFVWSSLNIASYSYRYLSRKVAGEVDVHVGEVWATDRCPHAAVRHHTMSTLSAEMAHIFSRADVDTASKGRFTSICGPLTERPQAVPAEDQTLSLSYFYLFEIYCKTYLESLLPTCPSLSVSLPLKRISAILEMHIFHAAVLQQLLQIENKYVWIAKYIL